MADIESRNVATLLHAGLVAVDQDGKVEPRAAERWERRDSQTWAFTLKPNLAFSDQSPVDARAVVGSLCASMQPDHLWSWSLASIERRPLSDGKGVECTGLGVEGRNVVLIRETRATPWLLEALSGPGGWIVGPKNERTAAQPYGDRPGLGPYVIDSVRPDVSLQLRARTDGGAATLPVTKAVVFRFVPDAAVAAKMFERGDLDVLRIETPQMYKILVGDDLKRDSLLVPGVLLRHHFSRVRTVIVNLKGLEVKGFTSTQATLFRQAYSLSVDRARLSSLAFGNARPLRTAFPPAATIAQANDPTLTRDLAPAAAGQSIDSLPSIDLTLLTNNDSYSDLIAAQLPDRVGPVRIKYRAVDFGVLLNEVFAGKHDLISISLDATIEAPSFWAAFWTPGAPFLIFGHPIEDFKLLDLTDPNEITHAAALADLQGNWVPLTSEEGLVALSPRVQGIRLTRSGQLSFETVRLSGTQ